MSLATGEALGLEFGRGLRLPLELRARTALGLALSLGWSLGLCTRLGLGPGWGREVKVCAEVEKSV